jgi:hypothetical protein
MSENTFPHLVLFLADAGLLAASSLFQEGVGLPATAGDSVRRTLTEAAGVPADYLESRVQTVFLDGHPVDDLDAAAVADGSVLALSAAMPGLVGAVMRRGGFYARLRESISHHGEAAPLARGDAVLVLKVFNLLLPELVPLLLRRGVLVDPQRLTALLRAQPQAVWDACGGAQINGTQVDLGRYDLALPQGGPPIRFQVREQPLPSGGD